MTGAWYKIGSVVFIALYAGLTALQYRITGTTQIIVAMLAGACLAFGLWFTIKAAKQDGGPKS